MRFYVKDPLLAGWSRIVEAEDEEDAIGRVAEDYADVRGAPDFAYARELIYEPEED